MVENKLTNEELIKALECCIDSNCNECPYMKKKIDCAGGRQEKDCIDLINKLGGTTTRNSWKNKFLNALKENEEQKAEIERLAELQSRGAYRVAELGIENAELQKQIEAAYKLGYNESKLGVIKNILQEIDMFVVYGTFKRGGELRRIHNKIIDIAEHHGIDME